MQFWVPIGVIAVVLTSGSAVALVRTNAAIAADVRRSVRRPRTWLVGIPALVLVFAVGLPFVETRINGRPPPPLTFADLAPAAGVPRSTPGSTAVTSGTEAPAATTTTTTPPGAVIASVHGPQLAAPTVAASAVPTAWPIDGAWAIGAGTQARYGIDDTVVGQTSRVVGSTDQVSGTMQIVGTAVTVTRVVVNMASVTCHCVHDAKYKQLLEVTKYPTSTFVLSNPISLAALPAQGAVITVPVTGDFTIHGVTRSVTFNVEATRLGSRIGVKGTIPVKLSDYNISSPNAGSFGGLSNCDIELLLGLDPA